MLALLCAVAVSAGAAKPLPSLLVVDSQPTESYRTVTASMLDYLAEQGYADGQGVDIVHLSLGEHGGQAENIWKHYRGSHFSVVYAAGRLVRVEGGGDELPMEIRLFRPKARQAPAAEALWQRIVKAAS